jgi:threonyl-tRNA synthetase
MKCHFIEQFTKPDEKISIYKTGKFQDFCRGPHLPSTGKIKAFKLLNIAGAYWLGDEKIRSCSASTARRFSRRKISTPT